MSAAAFITASHLDGLKAYNQKSAMSYININMSANKIKSHPTHLLCTPAFFAACAAIKSINSGLKQS